MNVKWNFHSVREAPSSSRSGYSCMWRSTGGTNSPALCHQWVDQDLAQGPLSPEEQSVHPIGDVLMVDTSEALSQCQLTSIMGTDCSLITLVSKGSWEAPARVRGSASQVQFLGTMWADSQSLIPLTIKENHSLSAPLITEEAKCLIGLWWSTDSICSTNGACWLSENGVCQSIWPDHDIPSFCMKEWHLPLWGKLSHASLPEAKLLAQQGPQCTDFPKCLGWFTDASAKLKPAGVHWTVVAVWLQNQFSEPKVDLVTVQWAGLKAVLVALASTPLNLVVFLMTLGLLLIV